MYLRKVFSNDKFIRLENTERDSLTVYISGEKAYILSIMVGFKNRGMARGTVLLRAMEEILYNRGIKSFNAIYSSELLNVCDLLEKCGFSLERSAPVFSRNAMNLLTDSKTLKLINTSKKSSLFIPLSRLDKKATGKLLNFLKKRIKPFPMFYLTLFLQDESGVIFDDNNKIAGVILCSKNEESVHIYYFLIESSESLEYAVPLLAGFLYRISLLFDKDSFETVSLFPESKIEKKLVENYLADRFHKEDLMSFDAFKMLSAPKISFEIRDDIILPEEDFMRLWEKEVIAVPLQFNLFLKTVSPL